MRFIKIEGGGCKVLLYFDDLLPRHIAVANVDDNFPYDSRIIIELSKWIHLEPSSSPEFGVHFTLQVAVRESSSASNDSWFNRTQKWLIVTSFGRCVYTIPMNCTYLPGRDVL